jgi:hypothetical protein
MVLNLHLRLKFLFLEDLVNLTKLGFIVKVFQQVLLGIILIIVMELKILVLLQFQKYFLIFIQMDANLKILL